MTVSEESRLEDPFEYDDEYATLDQLDEDVLGPSVENQQSVSGRNRAVVPRGKTPATRMKHAAADKAEQSNNLREKFFVAAMSGTGVLLTVNVILFCAYMKSEWGHISEAVMLAWISASVVEVLGIIYIIARYLFVDSEQK